MHARMYIIYACIIYKNFILSSSNIGQEIYNRESRSPHPNTITTDFLDLVFALRSAQRFLIASSVKLCEHCLWREPVFFLYDHALIRA